MEEPKQQDNPWRDLVVGYALDWMSRKEGSDPEKVALQIWRDLLADAVALRLEETK